jgi:hypothetical protein
MITFILGVVLGAIGTLAIEFAVVYALFIKSK